MHRISACTAIALVGATIAADVARADCHFNTPNAIVCLTGRAAATAYQTFGFDVDRTNLSHNRAVMMSWGCGRPYGAKYAAARIDQIGKRGRVATLSGWVEVVAIGVNNRDLFYVAGAYLDGICKPYHVRTTSLPLDDQMPSSSTSSQQPH